MDMVMYHGTRRLIERFDQEETVDGGFHFGTYGQAQIRSLGEGQRIIEAKVSFRRLRRVRDTGGAWREQIEKAKRSGYDAIVYLNRYEGISLESINRAQAAGVDLDALSDREFRQHCPEARDSLIVFSPQQIEIIRTHDPKAEDEAQNQADPVALPELDL